MRVDLTVASLVMVFNMNEVSGLSKPWCLVEVSQISPEVRIVHDTLLVTLLIVMTYEKLHKRTCMCHCDRLTLKCPT